MDLSLPGLLSFARESVSDPRGAARRVKAVGVPLETGWAALALTAVVSTILFHVSLALLPLAPGAPRPDIAPLWTLAFQGAGLALAVILTWRIGQARGGTGTLPETVSLMAWLQFILLLVQVVQIAAEVVLPPLAFLIGFAGVGLFFWLFSHFVAELHDFPSVARVFAAILGVMFTLAFIVSLILVSFAPAA